MAKQGLGIKCKKGCYALLLLLRFFFVVVLVAVLVAAVLRALFNLDLILAALFGWIIFFAALSMLLCVFEKIDFCAAVSWVLSDEHALRAFLISVLRKDFWLALCSRRVSF